MNHNFLSTFLSDPNSKWFWVCWAVMLVWQNYAFTFVSRARNSGSLSLHMKAAAQSNGVWFLQSLFVYSAFLKILTGEYGYGKAVVAGIFYMVFTMSGSFFAHMRALKKESGMNAVGANKKYAQIPIEEYAEIKAMLEMHKATCNVEDDSVGPSETDPGDHLMKGFYRLVNLDGSPTGFGAFPSEAEAVAMHNSLTETIKHWYKVIPA